MYIMYKSASTNGSIFFQGRDIRALRGGAVKEETDTSTVLSKYLLPSTDQI